MRRQVAFEAGTQPPSHRVFPAGSVEVAPPACEAQKISPLRALNYLIHSFESDIVIIDYRVRGFTRDVKGTKHYIDHKINSVQNFVDKNTLTHYQAMDVNVYQENIFHTKMMLKDSKLDNYLFGVKEADLSPQENKIVTQRLTHEMAEIFYGTNMVRMN